MQENYINYDSLYTTEKLGHNVNKLQRTSTPRNNVPNEKNFLNALKNARGILDGLTESIRMSNHYEDRLLRCKATHSHSHNGHSYPTHGSMESEPKVKKTETENGSRGQVDVAESWSTMSVVCLQYQCEELSKRYENLLKAYDERCNALATRDSQLARTRERAELTHAQLTHAHRAVLDIGEKYLALNKKRILEKSTYESKTDNLKRLLRGVLCVAEKARCDLDAELARKLAAEEDAQQAVLLAEIRKCNRLYLENMRLKVKLEAWKPFFVQSEENKENSRS